MMRRSFRFLSFAFLVRIICAFAATHAVGAESEKKLEADLVKSKFDDISARLESLLKKLSDEEVLVSVPAIDSAVPEVVWVHENKEPDQGFEPDDVYEQEKDSSGFEEIKSIKEGYYIIPFFGVLMSNELEWESFGGEWEIDAASGVSGGVRFGYNLRNFFADVQISYFKNELKSINLPLPFSGEVDGVGYHFSGGGRFNFSELFAVTGGMGFGGVRQDVSFLLYGNSVNEKKSLFSTQLFAGLEYRPFKDMIIGLNYRLLLIQGMDSFNFRSLHLAELSAGYVF
jgi:opacity protein-like surface antigen